MLEDVMTLIDCKKDERSILPEAFLFYQLLAVADVTEAAINDEVNQSFLPGAAQRQVAALREIDALISSPAPPSDAELTPLVVRALHLNETTGVCRVATLLNALTVKTRFASANYVLQDGNTLSNAIKEG